MNECNIIKIINYNYKYIFKKKKKITKLISIIINIIKYYK